MPDQVQLKMISHEFRDLVSRAAHSSLPHLQINLRQLVDFVLETPLLREAVNAAPRPAGSVDDAIDGCMNRGQRRIDPPENRREELGFFHDLLVHMAGMEKRELEQIVMIYAFRREVSDSLGALMEDTVVRYATPLRHVITAALHEHAETSGRRVEVNAATGGLVQLVVHQGHGNVHSTQQASQQLTAVLIAARALGEILESKRGEDIDPKKATELREIAAETQRQVEAGQPSKWTLTAVRDKLGAIAGTLKATHEIRDYVTNLSDALGHWLSAGGAA